MKPTFSLFLLLREDTIITYPKLGQPVETIFQSFLIASSHVLVVIVIFQLTSQSSFSLFLLLQFKKFFPINSTPSVHPSLSVFSYCFSIFNFSIMKPEAFGSESFSLFLLLQFVNGWHPILLAHVKELDFQSFLIASR